MSFLHEIKTGARTARPLQQKRMYTCNKIKYRETQQKCTQEHLDHIKELQSRRSKTRLKTERAMIKV
jgi:hypothetical protein